MKRTTVNLDERALIAARQLSSRLQVSLSEVMRLALVNYRDQVVGVTPEFRDQRVGDLNRLFDLFEGHDAEAEVRRLKQEDSGY